MRSHPLLMNKKRAELMQQPDINVSISIPFEKKLLFYYYSKVVN
jgi:hypothetical protein